MTQTQMSLVFLTEEYVYKLKKPVDLGYVDYTTLDKRLYFCNREVELNRRLCPDVYLGVLPVTRDGNEIVINGTGETVDYAVKMKRLPGDAMMDGLLTRDRVTPEMITRVAERVADFHRKADVISGFGDSATITTNTEENFSQTEEYIGRTITPEQYRRIMDYTRNFVRENSSLFEKRVAEGRVRDCHGDLHAAHICFVDNVCIYDCIEFNDRFRYCDVAAEVSFLAMDIDRYEKPGLSSAFVDSYIEKSGDRQLLQLLGFYKGYFAYVRGKVEGFKLNDALVSDEDKAKTLAVARKYFKLAESYL
ncbi:MAG TPA: hypothetical protein G4O07_05570 [Dehalococcoidia bacterium]|nr:hypothetical protein [Dehalococcoidia bacterium]